MNKCQIIINIDILIKTDQLLTVKFGIVKIQYILTGEMARTPSQGMAAP